MHLDSTLRVFGVAINYENSLFANFEFVAILLLYIVFVKNLFALFVVLNSTYNFLY